MEPRLPRGMNNWRYADYMRMTNQQRETMASCIRIANSSSTLANGEPLTEERKRRMLDEAREEIVSRRAEFEDA